jgi:Family of unknown function (DUF6502)
MSSPSTLILQACLVLIGPLIRLMLRHGITYTLFTAALKKSFIDAATKELEESKNIPTDSAVSLLSGVHRRDIRNITRAPASELTGVRSPIGASAQLVAKWMSDPAYLNAKDKPISLLRTGGDISFDALAQSISSDVRPRALLDDLIRLGLVRENNDQIELLTQGFVPQQGFKELSEQFQNNLHDHLAAACANLSKTSTDNQTYLEQAIYVDQLSEESANDLHKSAAVAWRQAFKAVMRDAQVKFDFDQTNTKKPKRKFRVRFGAYFYSSDKD